MLRQIIALLTRKQRKKGIMIILSVLLRALLDFAGVAALIPILLVIMKQNSSRLTMLCLCASVLLFVILKNITNFFLARFQSNFHLSVYRDLSKKIMCNYFDRGMIFIKEKGITQLTHEVNYVCYTFSLCVLSPIFRMTGEIMLILMMVTALVVWQPLAGILLCMVFFVLSVLYAITVRTRLKEYGTEELEIRRKESRIVMEIFRGFPEIKIAGAFNVLFKSFEDGLGQIINCRLRMETFQLFPSFISEAAIVIGIALLILTGNKNPGLLGGVFAVAAFRLIPAVRGVLNSWITLQNASHTIKIIEDGLNNNVNDDELIRNNSNDNNLLSFNNSIELKGLAFAFPNGKILFENLNMTIFKGERFGIRGKSGVGKSTLFNLMLGLLKPTKGIVLIDNQKLTDNNCIEWHSITGYVPQEIFIIKGSLVDNIALGDFSPDINKVIDVINKVQLNEWVSNLPQNIYTQLGEFGSNLSGGQKQRIGIARALYKEAKILFFDEATSALDSTTEYEINNAIESLSNECRELTIIIISHRESSLDFCDRIFDLNTNCIQKRVLKYKSISNI